MAVLFTPHCQGVGDVSSHPLPPLLLILPLGCCILAVLIGVQQCLICGLVCISLISVIVNLLAVHPFWHSVSMPSMLDQPLLALDREIHLMVIL